MITDCGSRIAVSNLGWVDRGSIWHFDARSGSASHITLSRASYIALRGGGEDYFAAVHHWKGERMKITVQSFERPAEALAAVDVTDWAPKVMGDPSVWAQVPRLYLGYLNNDATGAAGYFTVQILQGRAELQRQDWFGADYDHMYQSVISASQVPETAEILFGVQRSSRLVLYDPLENPFVREVDLGNSGFPGNPEPWLSSREPVAWAVNYDTVVRIDRRSWQVSHALKLKGLERGAGMFVGWLWLPASEARIVVP